MRKSSASASFVRSRCRLRKSWRSTGRAAWKRIKLPTVMLGPLTPGKVVKKFATRLLKQNVKHSTKGLMQNGSSNPSETVSRRQFLKSTSIAAASAAAVVNFPAVLRAQASMKFNAIIIGVGGRGGGAGSNFLDAAKEVGVEAKIVAVEDIFPAAAQAGGKTFEVPANKCFSGFDAY